VHDAITKLLSTKATQHSKYVIPYTTLISTGMTLYPSYTIPSPMETHYNPYAILHNSDQNIPYQYLCTTLPAKTFWSRYANKVESWDVEWEVKRFLDGEHPATLNYVDGILVEIWKDVRADVKKKLRAFLGEEYKKHPTKVTEHVGRGILQYLLKLDDLETLASIVEEGL
ncbi:hypothetical protein HDV00_004356, partial [Rhizophlyctis rosea]